MELRCRLGAVDAGAPFDHVEVGLDDPLLAPGQLDQHREIGLQPFAQPVATRPKKDVLRGLHRDRAGAAQLALTAPIAPPRFAYRIPVEAVMLAEFGILASN